MGYKKVKVKLKKDVTNEDFWKATYNTGSNLGIRLVQNFGKMKEEYLNGKVSDHGSLEVAIPVSYYNREKETIDTDIIEYNYIKSMKDIWEIVD
ncbi:hypothetical protein GTH52_13860 [Clostridium tyrobutyricum]|jgi:hypothetical protein|uniref:Uncharacterized protein n=1 Tax=Clostridium tyrobutyricum DIVETGP TaxID=1408889 RepID=W6N534_CLOTY|nr:hypothetical protein [Clostridium tyrobutyricum]AND85986.1 hypothetical protein CTK_C27440 [Clostridium tyrobutyricum]ANP70474.1 hypothetical protein BA182_12570 [Clostridium tyrobutyricum]MBR9647488.1 hypothetical protein [Clostridium tyrobutyricum]MBV4414743.1 hypothetical protein [Clostridium tyrobutyricum]MBV4417923.1 hypothetical protein [Clostridium tyrobutyricum]